MNIYSINIQKTSRSALLDLRYEATAELNYVNDLNNEPLKTTTTTRTTTTASLFALYL